MKIVYRLVVAEVPTLKKAVLRIDNVTSYRNNLVPVIAPFIFAKYGFKLRAFIFSNIQDEKGPADIQFVAAKQFGDHYIELFLLIVMMHADLVQKTNRGEDMSGGIMKLFDVDNDSDQYRTTGCA